MRFILALVAALIPAVAAAQSAPSPTFLNLTLSGVLTLGGTAFTGAGTTATTFAAGNDSRIVGAAQKANNLSDLGSAATARTNLGLGTAAVQPVAFFAQVGNNLSDLANAATARTNLGLAAVAASGSASDLASGTLPAARMPAFTGDVGVVVGTTVATISPGVVGNTKLAQMPAGTVKANTGAVAANAADATPSAVLDAAFGTAQGSVLYRGAAAWVVLTPGTAGQYLATGGAGANAGWATPAGAGNVSTSGTPVAGQLAQFVNGTAVQGDTPTQGLTALGLNNAGQAGFRNRLINGGFSVNQRSYASGTALAANVYGHDRWKAGGSGLTYTLTQTYPVALITITAGSAMQVIEGAMIEGGSYTLSWTGTSTCRVSQSGTPALAASPIVATGFTANALATVECTTGTLGTVQLEPGTTASAFEVRPFGTELALAQRYFEQFTAPYLQSPSAGTMTVSYSFKVQKRAVPTVVTVTAPTYSGASGAIPNGVSLDAVGLQFTASGAGGNVAGWVVSASAEL